MNAGRYTCVQGEDAQFVSCPSIVRITMLYLLDRLTQSATLAAGPGPKASENFVGPMEKLTRTSEICIKLSRHTVPGPVKKSPNIAH